MFDVEGFRVVRLGEADAPAIQDLCERCGAFLELIEGRPPPPDAAALLLVDLPEGWKLEDKFLFGLAEPRTGTLVGLVDAIRGWPRPGGWALGLMMLDPAHRGGGLGARLHAAFEGWVRSQGGTQLRLIVQEQNPGALRFWLRQGYTVYASGPQQAPGRVNQVHKLEKRLDP